MHVALCLTTPRDMRLAGLSRAQTFFGKHVTATEEVPAHIPQLLHPQSMPLLTLPTSLATFLESAKLP